MLKSPTSLVTIEMHIKTPLMFRHTSVRRAVIKKAKTANAGEHVGLPLLGGGATRITNMETSVEAYQKTESRI